MTLRPRTAPRRGKGQPEGSAVTGKTRKQGVVEEGFGLMKQPVRITVIWHRKQPRLRTMDGN